MCFSKGALQIKDNSLQTLGSVDKDDHRVNFVEQLELIGS